MLTPHVAACLLEQELWLSVGDTLPDDEDEVQEELKKIGGHAARGIITASFTRPRGGCLVACTRPASARFRRWPARSSTAASRLPTAPSSPWLPACRLEARSARGAGEAGGAGAEEEGPQGAPPHTCHQPAPEAPAGGRCAGQHRDSIAAAMQGSRAPYRCGATAAAAAAARCPA